jgi:hypothetical protein
VALAVASPRLIENACVPSRARLKYALVLALAVLVSARFRPVKVVPLAFHVWLKSSTGADAVSVPLLAASVVKAPLFRVVDPIGVFWIEPAVTEPKVTFALVPRPRLVAVRGE